MKEYLKIEQFKPIRDAAKTLYKYNLRQSLKNDPCIPGVYISCYLVEKYNAPVLQMVSTTNIYMGEGDYGDIEYYEYVIVVKNDKDKNKFFAVEVAKYMPLMDIITIIDDNTDIEEYIFDNPGDYIENDCEEVFGNKSSKEEYHNVIKPLIDSILKDSKIAA